MEVKDQPHYDKGQLDIVLFNKHLLAINQLKKAAEVLRVQALLQEFNTSPPDSFIPIREALFND